jgi:hypothetical protein
MSHSAQEQTFDYYASFLRNILSGREDYKPLVQPIIDNTKSLVENHLDYFSIDRNGFDVIVYLAKKEPAFFTQLNPANVTNEQYAHILELITSPSSLTPD